jgi:uridine kinase
VPRGIENRVAIDMVVEHVRRTLRKKSEKHQEHLQRLGQSVEDEPLSEKVLLLPKTSQIQAMDTILQNPYTSDVDFIFYFDRLTTLLIERYYPLKARDPTNIIDHSTTYTMRPKRLKLQRASRIEG